MNKFDIILFDFDDTLWARDTSSESDYLLSRDNILLLNKLAKSNVCTIISGNAYDTIRKKIEKAVNLADVNFDIWADANSNLYINGKVVKNIESHAITVGDSWKLTQASFKYNLHSRCEFIGNPTVNVKIKPLTELERSLLCDVINSSGLKNSIAVATGKTTVDILSTTNTKLNTLDDLEGSILYIGDEVDKGNDKDIACACDAYVKVEDVEETNTLLQLLIKKLVADQEDNSRGK